MSEGISWAYRGYQVILGMKRWQPLLWINFVGLHVEYLAFHKICQVDIKKIYIWKNRGWGKAKKRINGGRKTGGKGRRRQATFKNAIVLFALSHLYLTEEHFNDMLVSHQLNPPSNLPLNIDSAPPNNHPCSWGSGGPQVGILRQLSSLQRRSYICLAHTPCYSLPVAECLSPTSARRSQGDVRTSWTIR